MTKTKIKAEWKRVRGGLHHLVTDDGSVIAEVERGAETRRWWWVTLVAGEPRDTGIEGSMRIAKIAAAFARAL